MLRRRDYVASLSGEKPDIPFSVGRGVGERSSPSPVLVPTVDVENPGRAGAAKIVAQSGALAGNWVTCRNAGEWKDIGRIKERRIRLCIARRLCKAMVEAAASGASGVSEESVKRDTTTLVGVETLIEVVADESARLRNAVPDPVPNVRDGR